jgi:hypothetical protein
MRTFLREIARGRGLAAGKELAALRRDRARVNAARSAGGALAEFFLKQNCREALLEIDDRVDRDDAGARAAGCQCLILGRDFGSFDEFLARLRSDFPTCFDKAEET